MTYKKFSSRLIGIAPRFAEVVLVMLLLWQLAGLFWLALIPVAHSDTLTMPVPIPPASPYSTQALQKWFSRTPLEPSQPASDLQLMAVVTGRNGVAVFTAPGMGSVAVRSGEPVRPGSRVVAITAHGVEVEQNGLRRTIALPGYDSGDAAQSVIAPAISKPGLKPPGLTRGQLSALLREGNLADWGKGLSSYRDGGVLINSVAAQPMMQALTLRPGDVMKEVNRKPIRQLSDVSLLYNELSQQSSIELSVLRDGSPQNLLFNIQP